MKKYYDGLEIKASAIIEDEKNWEMDCINNFTKIAYYIGINEADGLCTQMNLDGTGICTIERYY